MGLIHSAQLVLKAGTRAYHQGILFIMMYQALFDKLNANAIAICR